MRLVKNHWGWSWQGIKTYFRYGFSFFDSWRIALIPRDMSSPRQFRRIVKIGFLTFDTGIVNE